MSTQRKSRRSAPAAKPPSPLSDSLISREQEKTQLIGLNDRLAAYIDRVRRLELENSQLQMRVTSYEETSEKEYDYIKEMYHKELEDVRKLLDETAGDKARALVEAGSLKAELEDLKPKLDKSQNELETVKKRIPFLERTIREKESQISPLTKDNKELKKNNDELHKNYVEFKSLLDNEKLKVVELENQIQSMKEDMDFKEKLYTEEVMQMTKRSTSFAIPLDTTNDDHNISLLDSLHELRDQHEKQKAHLPKEPKITVTDPLIDRIQDLEKEIQVLRIKHRDENNKYDQKVKNLQDQVATQLQEYNDLLDLKLSLDDEITTYRKLLDEFANKLNTGVPSSSPSPQKEAGKPKRKRPRLDSDEQNKEGDSANLCRFM